MRVEEGECAQLLLYGILLSFPSITFFFPLSFLLFPLFIYSFLVGAAVFKPPFISQGGSISGCWGCAVLHSPSCCTRRSCIAFMHSCTFCSSHYMGNSLHRCCMEQIPQFQSCSANSGGGEYSPYLRLLVQQTASWWSSVFSLNCVPTQPIVTEVPNPSQLSVLLSSSHVVGGTGRRSCSPRPGEGR